MLNADLIEHLPTAVIIFRIRSRPSQRSSKALHSVGNQPKGQIVSVTIGVSQRSSSRVQSIESSRVGSSSCCRLYRQVECLIPKLSGGEPSQEQSRGSQPCREIIRSQFQSAESRVEVIKKQIVDSRSITWLSI